MKVQTRSVHRNILRSGLCVALAIGAFTALGARAHAEQLDPITLSAPEVRTLGRDSAGIPMEETTVQARIAADAQTLRNDSGVVLLKDRVVEAARQACAAADPFTLDDGTCVHQAIKAAQPQVAAAIAHARNTSGNG
jgi:UrcA family protein